MPKFQTGHSLAIQLLEACGLPAERIASVSIDLSPDNVASITVTRLIDADEAGKIATIVQQYELHERQAK